MTSTKWRYLVESFFGGTAEMTAWLNEKADEGWEVVSVGHNSMLGSMVCVFRRPREEAP